MAFSPAGMGMGIVTGIFGLAAANQEAAGMEAMGKYKRIMGEINQRYLEMQAQDATDRGDRAAYGVRRKSSQVKGSQRAALAAQGLNLGMGSAADLQSETDYLSELEQSNIKSDAFREAWGYKVKGYQALEEGRLESKAYKERARQTLTAAGMDAIGGSYKGAMSGGG